MFESQYQIMNNMTWQAFERNLCRLLTYEGYDNVRLVGQTGDHGADVTGNKAGKKWLFQAKHWKKPVGLDVAQETINAVYEYKADIPVIVSSNGFDAAVKSYQSTLLARKIPLQLWDSNTLVSRTKRLPDKTYTTKDPNRRNCQRILCRGWKQSLGCYGNWSGKDIRCCGKCPSHTG